jgi:hypothetical protein
MSIKAHVEKNQPCIVEGFCEKFRLRISVGSRCNWYIYPTSADMVEKWHTFCAGKKESSIRSYVVLERFLGA